MTKENKKTVADFHEQNMEKLKAFRPIDDEFMRILLRNNKLIELTKEQVRILVMVSTLSM